LPRPGKNSLLLASDTSLLRTIRIEYQDKVDFKEPLNKSPMNQYKLFWHKPDRNGTIAGLAV
jgi:hypothetical protein